MVVVSRETTEARAEARAEARYQDDRWVAHVAICSICASVRKARFPLASLCPEGRVIRMAWSEARAELQRNRAAGWQSISGQERLL
jgi:hypothetical protein